MPLHQTGSNITEGRLRFDFSHEGKLSKEQIEKIEKVVNRKIKVNLKVYKKLIPKVKAQELGAIGLFDQKYGQMVNVYYIGTSQRIEDAYSKEFCGGPHIDTTGVLENFRIIKEESTGSSIRRIYAKIGK